MLNNKFKIPALLLILLLYSSCNRPQEDVTDIDFSPGAINQLVDTSLDTLPILSVAVAPVISPKESFVYYNELFDYMGERLNMKIEFRQRMSYSEVNNLLERNMVDLAFICTGAYVEASAGMDLLVGPVFNDKTFYHAYVITHVNSGIYDFKTLQGRTFAYTDPLSHTGKLYPMKRIMEMGADTATFFKSIVYSNSHDVSIQMVSRNLIDGASVSGLIYEYLLVTQPQMMQNLRIVEKSEPFGVPPIVTSLLLDPLRREEIRQLLLNMHLDEQGREILEKLLIERFDVIDDTLYSSVRTISDKVWP